MLNNFCGFRLNTAGVIIGWVGAVISLFVVVLISIAIAYVDEIAAQIAAEVKDPNWTQADFAHIVLIVLCVYLTINAINLTASALLIVGSTKERHLLLVPWLLNAGVFLFIVALNIIYLILMGIAVSAPFSSIAISVISSGLSFVFQFYIWCAVYSLFKQIQASRDQQQRLIPATSSSYPSYTKI